MLQLKGLREDQAVPSEMCSRGVHPPFLHTFESKEVAKWTPVSA